MKHRLVLLTWRRKRERENNLRKILSRLGTYSQGSHSNFVANTNKLTSFPPEIIKKAGFLITLGE